ncbi:fibronectin type III domain protein, partial [gut metagenome]
GAMPAELDQVITEHTELDNTENRLFEKVITAPEDGAYYIGFRATSNPASIIFIDSVSVSMGCDPASPAQVENLKVTPDQTGELKVTLDFNLPTKTYGGADLAAITRYEVLKGDAVLAQQEGGLRPGDAVSVVDENASKGVNTYRIYCYNEAGQGARTDATTYAGLDYPAPPVVHADDQQTQVRLYWEPVTGLYGGVINQKQVACSIYDLKDENTVIDEIGVVGGGATE